MEYDFLIIIGIVLFSVVFLFGFFFKDEFFRERKKVKKVKEKDRNKIIKSSNKKLAINPRDPDAILALADLYFREGTWDRAFKHYSMLIDLCPLYPSLDEFEISLNYGISALQLQNFEEAYKALMVAKNINADDPRLNYNLGYIEFIKKNYEKASVYLTRSYDAQSENVQNTRLLGISLYKIKKYSEASILLEKATEYEPDDKDSLFALAHCYCELGNREKALLIFTHLRPDTKLGAKASLMAGTINLNQKQYNKAIMDFEIGLRHKKIDLDTRSELLYRLAVSYVRLQEIERALNLLREIQGINPNYKDINDQITKYQELSSNKNLKTFLIAPTSDFITLCKTITMDFFTQSRVKILDITIIKNQYTDILAEIDTKKWEDIILFRFIRSTGTVGELVLRELYSRCKELRAGRAFCIHAGEFSDGAKQFVEARLIDLIPKKDLVKLFERLSLKRN
ncbi:MAG: tetratricopeptide repeat protein [Spirochaetales bacterium]|nr:tetratricopeptide repeat protein [Spirochaetales bacterium]